MGTVYERGVFQIKKEGKTSIVSTKLSKKDWLWLSLEGIVILIGVHILFGGGLNVFSQSICLSCILNQILFSGSHHLSSSKYLRSEKK